MCWSTVYVFSAHFIVILYIFIGNVATLQFSSLNGYSASVSSLSPLLSVKRAWQKVIQHFMCSSKRSKVFFHRRATLIILIQLLAAAFCWWGSFSYLFKMRMLGRYNLVIEHTEHCSIFAVNVGSMYFRNANPKIKNSFEYGGTQHRLQK